MGGMTCLLLLLWAGVTASTVVDLQKRIIGGQTCRPNERLYHVELIEEDGSYLCGGSLLNNRWILTAAHCLQGGIRVALPSHPTRGHIVQITAYHVFMDNQQRPHDIMLMQLQTPVNIPTVPLPPVQRLNVNDPIQIAGHGPTVLEPERSATLQCADTRVVACPWVGQNNHPEAHQHMFCGQTRGVDVCGGDSGGGVVNGGRIYGVIVTGGEDPCTLPIGIMDVTAYLPWINGIIGP